MLVVSAITLNLWRMFDESKLSLLLDLCVSNLPGVRQRALVGLCFVLARHNSFIPYFPQIRNRLVLLTDDNHIAENLSNIFIQIISTNETDKISKKMQEEILPEMMKISPLLKDSMNADSLLNSDEWEEGNPEWQEIIESSGVGDKLRELSEMQQDGADVYMSTFSLLKSFGFFSEISNWFLSFDTQHSAISELFATDDASLMNAFIGNNAMCNSDKYSFCLSIMQMPILQRNNLKHSFKMESEQLEEMAKDEALLSPNLVAKNISKQYIQDLFRFFKLNPNRADFSDMFGSTLNLHSSFLFDILSSNSDLKMTVAEYYFSKEHYQQAIELFNELIAEQSPSSALHQKMGFAYQKTTQLLSALDAYIKADMLQPDDLWTVKKIALCYRLLGNSEKALEYYQHADYLQPEQQSIQMNIGQSLLELGKYVEALKLFYKLDALADNNLKVWRAISWTLFVSKNYEQANYYIAKLIDNEPTKYDFMNAAHIAWCIKDIQLALNHYTSSLRLFERNFEFFLEAFNQDKKYLLANGIDNDEIALMLDQLLYSES
jgi:tetratricopeptide (TPR) repeat protein